MNAGSGEDPRGMGPGSGSTLVRAKRHPSMAPKCCHMTNHGFICNPIPGHKTMPQGRRRGSRELSVVAIESGFFSQQMPAEKKAR